MKNSIVEINPNEEQMIYGGIEKEDVSSLFGAIGSVVGFALAVGLLRFFRKSEPEIRR